MTDAHRMRPESSVRDGRYRPADIVVATVFAPATHERQGFKWLLVQQLGRPAASPAASAWGVFTWDI